VQRPAAIRGVSYVTHNASYDLMLHRVESPSGLPYRTTMGLPGGGANCIAFSAASAPSMNSGRLEATWQATTPLTEMLELVVGGAQVLRKAGPSPLVIEFEEMEPEATANATMVWLQLEEGGVAFDQAVQLQVTMKHPGAAAEPEYAHCRV
jgi:hypothetical protein